MLQPCLFNTEEIIEEEARSVVQLPAMPQWQRERLEYANHAVQD